MNASRNPRTPAQIPSRNEITPEPEQTIRFRAYELYEARGREDGHELDDWLRAEEELTHRRTKTVAA